MAHGDITHTDIPVSDLEAGKKFYGTLFGWNIAEYPGFEGYPMWQAPNKISGGGLAPRGDGFTQPRSYVEVDSIDDTLAKATVRAEIVKPTKGPKITILKYKNKTGYRKRQGHRQHTTQIKVTAIDA